MSTDMDHSAESSRQMAQGKFSEGAIASIVSTVARAPGVDRAIRRCRDLASGYDKSCCTIDGIREPWRLLVNPCPDCRVIGFDYLGSSYLGVGTYDHDTSVLNGIQHVAGPPLPRSLSTRNKS